MKQTKIVVGKRVLKGILTCDGRFYTEIDPKELLVDEYQRSSESKNSIKLINDIANNFDINAFGVLLCNVRENGYIYVYEGNHRRKGAIQGGITKVPIMLTIKQTVEAEAKAFDLASHNRKNTTSRERFNIKITAKDEQAMEIKSIIEDCGFSLTDRVNNIANCLSTLTEIHKMLGADGLTRTLRLIAHTWKYEKRSCNNMLMQGIAKLIRVYGNKFDDLTFINKLSDITPDDIVQRVQVSAKLTGKSQHSISQYVNVLIDGLNKRRKVENRLLPYHG